MKLWHFSKQGVSLSEMRLSLELRLRSMHRLWLLPCILGSMLLVVHMGVLYSVEARLMKQQNRLDTSYSELSRLHRPTPLESDDSGWQALMAVLPSAAAQDASFQSIFQSAKVHDVRIAEAAYRAVKTPFADVSQTTVMIPVKGRYPDIRAWFDDVLLAHPELSLDDITFKRDSVGNGQIEAQLHFTLTTRSPQAAPAQAAPAQPATPHS